MASSRTNDKASRSPSDGKSKKAASVNKRKVDDTSTTSSIAKNKKRALKHERQSHRKHYDEVTRAKAIWNRLRLKTNEKSEVEEMMSELMDLLTGRMKEVSLQHDASRVVQAAIQFGNADQRTVILKELGPAIPELSKVQYAHFVVLKLITYCCRDEANQRVMVKFLKGNIPKLAVHSVGARVVEVALSNLPPKTATPLRHELYGPHFTLFVLNDVNSNARRLKLILEQHPDKKEVTLKHILSILNKGVEKALFGFSYFQDLFYEYAECCSPNEMRDVASSVVDHSIHMLSTRAGAKVVAHCAACGTAKDRKRIMKSLKGYTRSSLLHRDAYLAILRLVDVTDDTVTVQKLLLAEITVDPDAEAQSGRDGEGTEGKISPLLELALSDTASKLFLLILAGSGETSYFDPAELEMLRPATIVEGGEGIPTSKKDPKVRREELANYLRGSLCDLCLWHCPQLMRSRCGSKVLSEVYRFFPAEELASAIVDATAASDDPSGQELSVFEDPVAHRFIKNILLLEADPIHVPSNQKKLGGQASRNAGKETDISFAKIFLSRYKGGLFSTVASSNRGAFVLAALAAVPSLRQQVKDELEDKMDIINEKAKAKKGFEALRNTLQSSD